MMKAIDLAAEALGFTSENIRQYGTTAINIVFGHISRYEVLLEKIA